MKLSISGNLVSATPGLRLPAGLFQFALTNDSGAPLSGDYIWMHIIEGGGGFGASGMPLQTASAPVATDKQGVALTPEIVLGPRAEANRIVGQAMNAHVEFAIQGNWKNQAVLTDLTQSALHSGLCNSEVLVTVDLRDKQFPMVADPTQRAIAGARIGVEVTDGGGWISAAGRMVRQAVFETTLLSQISFGHRFSSREETATIRVYLMEWPDTRLDIQFQTHAPRLLSCETPTRLENTDTDGTTWLSKMVRVGTADALQDQYLAAPLQVVDHVEIGLRNLSGGTVYPTPRAGWGGESTLVTRPPAGATRIQYELWLPDYPDDGPPGKPSVLFRQVLVPCADRYSGPPVAFTPPPNYVQFDFGGVRDDDHGVEIVGPVNDVQYIGPVTNSPNPFSFTLITRPLPNPQDTMLKVIFAFKVRSTPGNSIIDDPGADPNNVPGGISTQFGGPYTDSVTVTIDITQPSNTIVNAVSIYYQTSQQDRDCVVETTATVSIEHRAITGTVVLTEATSLLARALFLRPRLSFTKKVGSAYAPVDDEAIIPPPTIGPGGNVYTHDPAREFYLEYRTNDPNPANPNITVKAQLFGGGQENDVTLRKVSSSVECAVFRSRPIVCYLEQPGSCGVASFTQLAQKPAYQYVLADWGETAADRPYSITASLTPTTSNPLQTTFTTPTRPLTFVNIEAATDDVLTPQVPAPEITLDGFNSASQFFPVAIDTTVNPPAIKLAISGSIRDLVGDVTPDVANRINQVTINTVTFQLTSANHFTEPRSRIRPYAGYETFFGYAVLTPGFNTVQVSVKNILGRIASRTLQVELLDSANVFTKTATMTARVRITEEPPVAAQGTPFAFVHYRTSHAVPGQPLAPTFNVEVDSLAAYPSTAPPIDTLNITLSHIPGVENTYVSGPILVIPDKWDPAFVTAARAANIVLLQHQPGTRLLVQGTFPTRLGNVDLQNLNNSADSRLRLLVQQGGSWVEQKRFKVGDYITFEADYLQPVNPGPQEVVVTSCDHIGRELSWPDWFVTVVLDFDPVSKVWTMQGVEDLSTGALIPASYLVAVSRHGQSGTDIPLRVLGGGTIQVDDHWYWSVDHDPVRQPLGAGLADQESQRGTSARMGARNTVVARTGELVIAQSDAALIGRGLHLNFVRTYRSFLAYDGPIGYCWSHSLESWLHRLSPDTYLWVGGGGLLATFTQQAGSNTFLPDQAGVYALLQIDTVANLVRVQWAGGGQEVFAPRAEFDPDYLPLTARYDRCRNKVAPIYDQSGALIRAEDPLSQPLYFVLDLWLCISAVGDHTERRWLYRYFDGTKAGGQNGDLQEAVEPAVTWALDRHPPAVNSFTYDPTYAHKLKDVQDPKGNQQNLPPLMSMRYYPTGQVENQHFGYGSYKFTYVATQTTMLDRKDNKRTFDFKPGMTGELDTIPVTYTEYNTTGTAYVTAQDYNSQGEIKSITPPAGSVTPASQLVFNETAPDPRDRGNLNSRTLISVPGLPQQYQNLYQTVALDFNTDPQPAQFATLQWGYTYTAFQQVATVTDPLQRVTTYHYDALGNLIQVDYPLVSVNVLGGTRQQYISYAIYDNYGDVMWKISPAGVVARHQYYPASAPNGGLGVGPVTAPNQPSGHLYRTTLDCATPPPTPQPVPRSPSLTPSEERRIDNVYDTHGYLASVIDPARNLTTLHYDELGTLKQRIEPDGPTYDFFHDENGQLIKQSLSVVDLHFPAGVVSAASPSAITTCVPDRIGNITTTTVDPNGLNLITQHEYDPNENLQFVRTPMAMAAGGSAADRMRYTKNDYDGLDRLIHSTIAPDVSPARKTDYAYYPDGKLQTVTDASGYTTSYFYNCYGYQVEEVDKDGNSRRTWRDLTGHVTVLEKYGTKDGTTSNLDSLSKSFVYLDELDREIAHADQVFRYDAMLTRQNIGRRITQWYHDADSNVVETVNPRLYQVTSTFNGHGQKRTDQGPLTGNSSYSYDATGNLQSTTLPPGPGFPAISLIRTYDASNRKTSEQKLGGGMASYYYDTLGRLRLTTDQIGNLVIHIYDLAGRRISMTRQMREYGSLRGTVQSSATIQYAYDLNSNLLNVTDGNQKVAITYTYEAHEQVQTATYPNDGFTQFGRAGAPRTTTFVYQADGLLQSTTTADGLIVTHQYTNAKLLSQRTVSAPAGVLIPGTTLQKFTYDGAGRCMGSRDNNGDPNKGAVTTTRYDSLDNIWEGIQKEPFSGTGARASSPAATYSAAGELTQITYPGLLLPIPYSFDPAGRPGTCGQFASYLYTGSYLTSRQNSMNRITLSLTQNAQSVLQDHLIKDAPSATILGGNSYKQWNQAALPVLSENFATSTSVLKAATSSNEEFVYDSAYRVLTSTQYDTNFNKTSISVMQYDPAGNPLLVQTGSTTTPGDSRWSVRVVNDQNQIGQMTEKVDPKASFDWLKIGVGAALVAESLLVNPAGVAGGGALIYGGYSASKNPGVYAYYYDARGNIVRKDYNGAPQNDYLYDVFNRLIATTDRTTGTTTLFYYDAMGRRLAKDQTAFSYLGKHLLQEEPGAGGWHKHYFYASDDLVGFATDQHGSLTQYFANDDRGGSILFLSDNAGDIRESYTYDLFGKPKILNFLGQPVALDAGLGNYFLHQGQYFDWETGLYCVGSRYYDPFLQRFLQPDTVSWDLDTNRYSYVGNNTQCLRDSNGNQFDLITVGLAILGVAAVGFLFGAAVSAAQQTLLYIDTKGESGFSLQSVLAAGAMGAVCGAAIELVPGLAMPMGLAFTALGVRGAIHSFQEGHFRTGALDVVLALLPFWHGVRNAFREPAPSTVELYIRTRFGRPAMAETRGSVGAAAADGDWAIGEGARIARLKTYSMRFREGVKSVEYERAPIRVRDLADYLSQPAPAEFTPEIQSLASAGRHVTSVMVLDTDGTLLTEFFEVSNSIGRLGHTEVETALRLYGQLRPGQMVIIQGTHPVCFYGYCHSTLSDLALVTGADVLYYAHQPRYVSLRTYLGHRGFVPGDER